MKYKAVIFDLDGVLCRTDRLHDQAWGALAARLGISLDRGQTERMRGVSRMESLRILLERSPHLYSKHEYEVFAEEKNRTYRDLLSGMTPADCPTEVRETLGELRKSGLLLAVGSSSKNTPLILERLGLGEFFDAVSDGNQLKNSKPDPEVFLRAATLLGCSPAECLVVEDAGAGILAGQRGGFDTAGIAGAAGDSRATYRITSFRDLIGVTA